MDDAVAQANALNRAFAIAQKTDPGTVWVNKHLDLPLDVAFSGAEQSGFALVELFAWQTEPGGLVVCQRHYP